MTDCVICQASVPVGSRGVTCSFSCRAKLRESRKTTEWRKPREYPADVVERVRHLYADRGMTVAEVQAEIGPGIKVQRVMERHSIPARLAAKREQRADKNTSWRGADASYTAAHTRVYSSRGRAADHPCEGCGKQAKDWSYVGGCPLERRDDRGRTYSPNPTMYAARCRKCHRAFDAARRAA